jgi:hypothetical protein
MTFTVNNPESFTTYPNHRILAIIEDREMAKKAMAALNASDLSDAADIQIFFGQGGAEALDADHGSLFDRIAKFLRSYGDVENEALHIYESALKEGDYVFAVPSSDDHEKETIRKILSDCGARDLNYFSTWVVEALEAA